MTDRHCKHRKITLERASAAAWGCSKAAGISARISRTATTPTSSESLKSQRRLSLLSELPLQWLKCLLPLAGGAGGVSGSASFRIRIDGAYPSGSDGKSRCQARQTAMLSA